MLKEGKQYAANGNQASCPWQQGDKKKNGCQTSVWPHSTENCSNYFPQVHPFNLTLHSGLQCLPNIVRCFLRVALAQDL